MQDDRKVTQPIPNTRSTVEKITLYYITLHLIEMIKRGGHFQHLT
jgi:hypothetical protein